MNSPRQSKRKTPVCVGNKCYTSITHTTIVKIAYAGDIEEDCPVIQPENEAQLVKQARDLFHSFAVAHCKLWDEYGHEIPCDSPCECTPQISDIKTENLGTGKCPNTNKCYVSIKVTGTICCRCEY